MATDAREQFRHGQPVGDGSGVFTVEGERYALTEVGLELYHCDAEVADWNLFAFADRPHGAHGDSIGVGFHGELSNPPSTPGGLTGADLLVVGDNEGWECDFVINGEEGELTPGKCRLHVLGFEGGRVQLELRGEPFMFMTGNGTERDDIGVSLKVEAKVIGMWQGTVGNSERLL